MAFPAPATAWNYAETSGDVVDRTGNSRGFTPTGTTTRTSAGGGYTYGGTVPGSKGLTQASNEIQAGPSPSFLNVAAWSMATWAKAGPADPSWFLELFSSTLGGGTGVAGWLMLSSSLRGRIKNSSNTAFEQAVTPDAANYHYFAITHDGTNLKVYRDTGGTVALIGTIAAAFTRATADAFRVFDNSGSGCILSDTRMWTTALTLAELQEASQTPVVDTAAVSGSFTGNLPALTGAMTGTATARGTAAGPIPGFVGALTGSATARGAEDGMLPALVGSFAGAVTARGTTDATLPSFTGTLTGSAEADGVVAGPLPGFVGAFSGNVGGTPSGILTAVLPRLVGSLTGHVDTGAVSDLLLYARVESQWHAYTEPNPYAVEVEA